MAKTLSISLAARLLLTFLPFLAIWLQFDLFSILIFDFLSIPLSFISLNFRIRSCVCL